MPFSDSGMTPEASGNHPLQQFLVSQGHRGSDSMAGTKLRYAVVKIHSLFSSSFIKFYIYLLI